MQGYDGYGDEKGGSIYDDIVGGGYSSAMSDSLPTVSAGTEEILGGNLTGIAAEEAAPPVREAANAAKMVRAWTLEEVAPLAAVQAPWWPPQSTPPHGGEIMRQIGGDGMLREAKLAAKRANSGAPMTLPQLKTRLEDKGLSPRWLLPSAVLCVWGGNAAGHGFGVAIYVAGSVAADLTPKKLKKWKPAAGPFVCSYVELIDLNMSSSRS